MAHNVACFSKRRLSWMAAAALSSCIAQSALACASVDSVYYGTVCMTANQFCPQGYMEAQGQLLPINTNQALYSLLGTVYGGDGKTNFALPDLRGRAVIGYGQGPGLSNVPMGLKRGQEGVVQTVAQMPAHTHTATFQPAGSTPVSVTLTAKQVSGQNQPAQGYMLGAGGTGPGQAPIYVDPATAGNTVALGGVTVTGGGGGGTVTIGATGASQPTPTIPPQIALRACIAVSGLYPPRP